MAPRVFINSHLHGSIFMLMHAKRHDFAGVALQREPYEHKSQQASGEENFHENTKIMTE